MEGAGDALLLLHPSPAAVLCSGFGSAHLAGLLLARRRRRARGGAASGQRAPAGARLVQRQATAVLTKEPGTQGKSGSPGAFVSDGCAVVRMGDKGMGVVAMRDIARGEVLVVEAPVIAVPTLQTEDSVHESVRGQFRALPAEAQRAVMSLHDNTVNHLGHTLEGIWDTNNFAMGDGTRCLFLEISRFNHSCKPNCESYWREDGKDKIQANSDIPAGEELCITYVDYDRLLAPRPDRRGTLQREFGMRCLCATCRGADAGSDERRGQIRELQRCAGQRGAEPQQRRELWEELLRLYDEEGLHSWLLAQQALCEAFQLSNQLNDASRARQYLHRAHADSVVFNGPAHPYSLRLGEMLESSRAP